MDNSRGSVSMEYIYLTKTWRHYIAALYLHFVAEALLRLHAAHFRGKTWISSPGFPRVTRCPLPRQSSVSYASKAPHKNMARTSSTVIEFRRVFLSIQFRRGVKACL